MMAKRRARQRRPMRPRSVASRASGVEESGSAMSVTAVTTEKPLGALLPPCEKFTSRAEPIASAK
jgi:hypothetical protein